MHVAAIAANAVGIGACATMLEPATAVNVLGLYGCGVVVVMFSGPLVAIKQVISEKSTKALPFAMTVATFVNCILWTTYVTQHHATHRHLVKRKNPDGVPKLMVQSPPPRPPYLSVCRKRATSAIYADVCCLSFDDVIVILNL